MLYVDELKVTNKHLEVCICPAPLFLLSPLPSPSSPLPLFSPPSLVLLQLLSANMTLDLTYSPVSIGKLRLWLIFSQAMQSMSVLGMAH